MSRVTYIGSRMKIVESTPRYSSKWRYISMYFWVRHRIFWGMISYHDWHCVVMSKYSCDDIAYWVTKELELRSETRKAKRKLHPHKKFSDLKILK